MSRVVIEPIKVSEYNKVATGVTALTKAVDGVAGAEITWDFADESAIVILKNANASPKTCTIKAGNGIQGVNDLVLSLEGSKSTIIVLDSGRFKNVSGADKGKVIIEGEDTNVEVGCLVGA